MAKKRRTVRRSGLLWRLRKHLGGDPGKLAVLEQTFEAYERPNLHLAIEELLQAMLAQPERGTQSASPATRRSCVKPAAT